ncbi:MAG TPA: potassium transporter Kup [Burkholderiales bacterium]|jgi:KUP system potassium uptake protein|nr:potassium transporter Kup [Burkholderiales bacterium]
MEKEKSSTPALALLALGVVYGDIGTSPLYAVKETFNPQHGIELSAENVTGGLSTLFWLLMIVVSLKYVTLVLRADNRGEGGIMALVSLATESVRKHPHWTAPLLALGVFGAGLLYGDAVLTPAISVLSAVEGLEIGTAAFKPYVVPLATGILVGLFVIQRYGTGMIGLLFGPICMAWFVAIAAAGAWNIAKNPAILAALDPSHALRFVTGHGAASFMVLSSVLLAITGAEALYADIGLFGKKAIRVAWFGLVAPALVLNYFGQGALLIADTRALENPFYLAFPSWALYPMVALGTSASVIASQATISGACSMTRQAIQLGYLPRMQVLHTSARVFGQIYIPFVNWTLFVIVAAAVIGFGASSRLASAYGVAVMGTMLATTFLTFFVIRYGWRYPLWFCLAATGFFLVIDLALFGSALLKIHDGGWFPLALGALIFVIMTTWRRGRTLAVAAQKRTAIPLRSFLESITANPPHRVPGNSVFMAGVPESVPSAFLHNLKHNKVLHERVVFLTVVTRAQPTVPEAERIEVEPLAEGFVRLRMNFGFMDAPDVAAGLAHCKTCGLDLDPMHTTFFLSRATVVPREGLAGGMAPWREHLFAAMARNARTAADYYNIPTNCVIELGTKVEI